MRIEVLNGVNLDVLGLRDPALYGGLSIDELETRIYRWGTELGCTVRLDDEVHVIRLDRVLDDAEVAPRSKCCE